MLERRWIINGNPQTVRVAETSRLLDVLRENLDLTGTKEGCGEGECGACSVLIDDRLGLACLTLAATLPDDTRILTVEGLTDLPLGRRVQEAFLALGAVQCGFCTPGMVMATFALLSANPDPDEDAIRVGLSGNLCRCTGYQMIVEAVRSCTPSGQGGKP